MTITALRPAGQDRSAEPSRWQPTRAGILNIWRYYDEVFYFHHGRLLLRGPNGTGKSKALELLLPYVFDANLRPHRLSTFGGSERTMYWNLMGDGYPGTTRVGYVWLEFARTGDDGMPEWFACGARLQANKNSRSVTPTYFTTSRRPGIDLELTTPDGRPLTRGDLAATLQESGEIYDTATGDYRRAVRHALFTEFTEEQYEALITALLQLRTPKLSEHLNPEELSRLLSQALPGLDHSDVTEIAEGFEKLDRRREELDRLADEVSAAESLAARTRNYSRRVLRAGAATLISATTAMDDATREARAAETAHADAEAERGDLEREQTRLEDTEHTLDHRIEGLSHSEAYREGSRLAELQQAAEAAARDARQDEQAAGQRRDEAEGDTETACQFGDAAAQAGQAAERAAVDTRSAAIRAALGGSVEEAATAETGTARRLLRAATNARLGQVAEVREALAAHGRAVSERRGAERRLEECREQLAKAEAGHGEAERQHHEALERLRADLRGWTGRCRELRVNSDALAAAGGDEAAVARIIGAAAATTGEQIATEDTQLHADRAELDGERHTYEAERTELHRAKTVEPTPPPTRTTDRAALPGGPLWRLVDWRPGVSEDTQAGVEAALQASGLLDAWVLPTGVVQVDGHDTFAEPIPAAPAGSLGDVLNVDPDTPVPADRVAALLRAVALGQASGPAGGAHPAAIGRDGTWRVGNLHGSWAKTTAEFIGATAQRRARAHRITELTKLIDELSRRIEQVDEHLAALDDRRAVLAAEQASAPTHDEVRELAQRLVGAAAAVAARSDAEAGAKRELAEAEQQVRDRLRELTLVASGTGLPADAAGLTVVEEAVQAYQSAADAWLDLRERAAWAAERAADTERHAQQSRRVADQAAERAEAKARDALGKRAKYEAVDAAVGADYREIVRRMAELRTELDEVKKRRNSLARQHSDLSGRLGELRGEMASLRNSREQRIAARDAAAERLRHLDAADYAIEAKLAAPLPAMTGVKDTLEAAQQVARELATVPYEQRNLKDAEHSLTQAMYAAQQVLGGRADLVVEPDGDAVRLAATVDGVRMGAAGLHDLLRGELAESRRHLSEDEQALFDRTLTGDTRRQVASRIRLAEELKDSMNAQLKRVRTASGLQIKLEWRVHRDAAPTVREARNLLLRDPAALSESDRAALHAFFRGRIDEVRGDDEKATGWEQQLLEVLDYRRWHEFVVQMRKGESQEWIEVTKRRHGALSGGEKAISLHLPLFAAAAAHYRVAPCAPRLILLDEVFVGVDEGNRGQLLHLLVKLDLDLVLTSDHEWCTYRELDGIAVHQLVTGEDDEAVTTVRFVWDGRRIFEDDPPSPPVWPLHEPDHPSLPDPLPGAFEAGDPV